MNNLQLHLKTVLTKEYFLQAHPGVENGENLLIENSFMEFLEIANEQNIDVSAYSSEQLVDVKYVIYLSSTIFNSCIHLFDDNTLFSYCAKLFKDELHKQITIKPVIVSLLTQSLQSFEDGSIFEHLKDNKFPQEVLKDYDPRDKNFFKRKSLMMDFILTAKSVN